MRVKIVVAGTIQQNKGETRFQPKGGRESYVRPKYAACHVKVHVPDCERNTGCGDSRVVPEIRWKGSRIRRVETKMQSAMTTISSRLMKKQWQMGRDNNSTRQQHSAGRKPPIPVARRENKVCGSAQTGTRRAKRRAGRRRPGIITILMTTLLMGVETLSPMTSGKSASCMVSY